MVFRGRYLADLIRSCLFGLISYKKAVMSYLIKSKILFNFFLILSVIIAPSTVFACAVCFTAKEETLNAYYGTAILLSILPLAMVGGLIFWVHRRYKDVSTTDLPDLSK